MPQTVDLIGIFEISALLGVSRQRVDQITRTDPAFPSPVAELHAGRVWLRSDVEEWARMTGRIG
jgi:predicted DNA-binding transcriptional regulator AlpA